MSDARGTLIFKLKIPYTEVEQTLLRLLQANGQINGNEEKYFTGMEAKGRAIHMEFQVPDPSDQKPI